MGDFESPYLRFGVFQNYCTWYLSFYFTFKFIEIVDILLFVDSSMPVIIFVESTNLYFDLFHFLYNAIKKKFNVPSRKKDKKNQNMREGTINVK